MTLGKRSKPRDTSNGVEDAKYSYWCTSEVAEVQE